ncbi:hypothetical protein HYV43_06710 [Candidatus Micrarchaeota archaeon]|nr:hypothetical protein [Candidatus Micrarchaeota archaeon]
METEFTHFYLRKVERLDERPKYRVGQNPQRLHLVPITAWEAAQITHLIQQRIGRSRTKLEESIQNMLQKRKDRDVIQKEVVGPYNHPGRVWMVEQDAPRAATFNELKQLKKTHPKDLTIFKAE